MANDVGNEQNIGLHVTSQKKPSSKQTDLTCIYGHSKVTRFNFQVLTVICRLKTDGSF